MTCVVAPSAGCFSGPPRETGDFREPDLVDIAVIAPEVRLDIRYASTNNFTGQILYRQPRAFLQRPAAEALASAQRALAGQEFGIVLFDAYRPWHISVALWEAADPVSQQKGFVANPKIGSKHNRGCAVDLSLFDLKSGELVPMPSGYDEFTERAYPNYAGGSEVARQNRDILRQAMEAVGFAVSDKEWWHFDYRDWRRYPLMDESFETIGH